MCALIPARTRSDFFGDASRCRLNSGTDMEKSVLSAGVTDEDRHGWISSTVFAQPRAGFCVGRVDGRSAYS